MSSVMSTVRAPGGPPCGDPLRGGRERGAEAAEALFMGHRQRGARVHVTCMCCAVPGLVCRCLSSSITGKNLNCFLCLQKRSHQATYFDTRDGMLGPDYSTKLSPWLALGCLSPRTVAAEVARYEVERVRNKSTGWCAWRASSRRRFDGGLRLRTAVRIALLR